MTKTTSQLAKETVDPAEARVTADFIAFLKAASLRRHPTGPVRRFNQGRAAGCVHAQFTVLDTLAAAHAAAGRFGEAARVAEQALQLAESAGPATLAAQIRARLALYRAGRPYQE